jgi:hypothetical protein
MARAFTYGWRFREARRHRIGAPIGIAYGSQFARRGVCPDDLIYLVSVHRGEMYLLGKILLDEVSYCAEEYLKQVGADPLPALEYVIAHAGTPARLVRVPHEVACRLRFQRRGQVIGLTFREGGAVDPQSLRGVRRLSAASAAALDKLLPATMVRADPRAGRNPDQPVPQKVSECRWCALQGRPPGCSRTLPGYAESG